MNTKHQEKGNLLEAKTGNAVLRVMNCAKAQSVGRAQSGRHGIFTFLCVKHTIEKKKGGDRVKHIPGKKHFKTKGRNHFGAHVCLNEAFMNTSTCLDRHAATNAPAAGTSRDALQKRQVEMAWG